MFTDGTSVVYADGSSVSGFVFTNNIAPDNAQWLYNQVHIGDPVIVKNTGATLKWGDGWTDWNVSFDEYVKGSAIPYTAKTGAAPSAGTAS